MPVPAVVTLLLDMAHGGVPEARAGFEWCLDAVDAEVRMFGAIALATYDPQRAADVLARELTAQEAAHRQTAARLLLHGGDARGLSARIDALELGARLYGPRFGSPADDDRFSHATRVFACRDLRVFTQQPLPCDATAPEDRAAEQVAAWRTWASAATSQPLRVREARLNLEAQYRVRPVTVGPLVAH